MPFARLLVLGLGLAHAFFATPDADGPHPEAEPLLRKYWARVHHLIDTNTEVALALEKAESSDVPNDRLADYAHESFEDLADLDPNQYTNDATWAELSKKPVPKIHLSILMQMFFAICSGTTSDMSLVTDLQSAWNMAAANMNEQNTAADLDTTSDIGMQSLKRHKGKLEESGGFNFLMDCETKLWDSNVEEKAEL